MDATTSNAHFARYLELAPAGDHSGEARISIAGRYRAPRADEDGAPEETTSAEPPEPADPTAPDEPTPIGPRRLAPHDTESTESPTGSSTTEPAPSGT